MHVLALRRSTRASEVRRIVPAGGGDILDRTADLAAISLPAGRIPALGGEFTADYDMVSVLLSVRPNVNRASPKVPAGRDSVAHRVHHMGDSAHALLPLETTPSNAPVVVRILGKSVADTLSAGAVSR